MSLVSPKRTFWHEIIHDAFHSAINSDEYMEILTKRGVDAFLEYKIKTAPNTVLNDLKKVFCTKDLEDYSAFIESLRIELEFYPNKEKSKVEDLLKNIQSSYDKIKTSSSSEEGNNSQVFPSKANLEEYLANYYNLSRIFFDKISLLYIPVKNKDSFTTVSEFLSTFPSQKGESIYSPYTIESMLKFYNSLEKASKTVTKTISNTIVREMIASVYSTKVFRDFRHSVIKERQKYLVSFENTKTMLAKNYLGLSSYEMIKPIRLFGKIKRHVESYEKEKYRIKIIGTVYIEVDNLKNRDLENADIGLVDYSPELKDLCDRLCANEKTSQKNYQIDIYLNKKSFIHVPNMIKNKNFKYSNQINIMFYFSDYDELSSVGNLDIILSQGDLILFLDCPFMYERFHIVSEEKKIEDWLHFLPTRYEDNSFALSKPGIVQMIQNQLNMFQLDQCEKVSHFERRLHERRIMLISERLDFHNSESEGSHKEVFIFISSQSSINVSKYSRFFQIRVEKYNAKEICLLHFPNDKGKYKKNQLGITIDSVWNNQISFSLWDIIVNTDPNLGEDIFCLLNGNTYSGKGIKNVSEYFSNIIVLLSWEESINHLCKMKFSFLDCQNKDIESIGKELEDMLLSYFNTVFSNNGKVEDAVLACMRNSFYNVFFSSITNVCQALMFHHLKKCLENNGTLLVEYVEQKNTYLDHKPHVSTTKKAYIDVIDNLSKLYPSGAIRDILVLRMKNAGLNPIQVYDNIICACQVLDYMDTELYKNTRLARSDLF